MHDIEQALKSVRSRIAELEHRYARDPGSVGLLAVSKTQPAGAVRAAFEAGHRDFGENHLQDALAKLDGLDDLALVWHFIGPIQSNKTRAIASRFAWVHSVDRLKIARRLNDQRPPGAPPLNVCLQVNISGETSKSGVDPGEVESLGFALSQLPRLRLRGLMAIPRPADGLELQRVPFRALADLQRQLCARGLALDTLSMGMTGDMEAAIAEGATIVRIGTAIFGERPGP